jgi:aspartate/methionine/tyrosine aminotransferase
VPLQIGDTWIDPPEGARFSEPAAIDPALYRYGATAGVAELRRLAAERLQSRRGFADVDPDRDVLLGCGGTHALACAARTLLDAGDDVLLAAPYWPLAHGIIHGAGARAIEVPLTDRLYADPSLNAAALLEASLTPRTRAVYLITPNNPDGKVLSTVHLAQIAELACARDLWVFADEVYADFAFELPHVSIAALPGMRARTVTVYSLSKSHALAGARIGYMFAPAEVIAAARRVSTHTIFNVPVIAQRAAMGALLADPQWEESAKQSYLDARDLAARTLREGGFDAFHLAEGGTYLFLDFSARLGARPLHHLLERAIEHGVLLAPGEAFGAAYTRCARICYTAVPQERLLDGLRRLLAALDEL